VIDTTRPNTKFYKDKIIIGNTEISKLTTNKIYPTQFPYFLNKPGSYTKEAQKTLKTRKFVLDKKWDEEHLDNKHNIKSDIEKTNQNVVEVHNIDEIELTKQQMFDIEQKLEQQRQENNKFIISTDHKKGLEE